MDRRVFHKCEVEKGRRHPAGLTHAGAESLVEMLSSPADLVGAGASDGPFKADSPAFDGGKVSILDTDHIWGHRGTPSWAWKCFVRRQNTLLMDSWDPIPGGRCGEVNWAARPGYPTCDLNPRDQWTWEPVRKAIDNVRALAKRVNFEATVQHNRLASTEYCLANPGEEYTVYLPEGDEVTVGLTSAPGSFAVEWMAPVEGTNTPGGVVKSNFAVPFPGAAVLYLR